MFDIDNFSEELFWSHFQLTQPKLKNWKFSGWSLIKELKLGGCSLIKEWKTLWVKLKIEDPVVQA